VTGRVRTHRSSAGRDETRSCLDRARKEVAVLARTSWGRAGGAPTKGRPCTSTAERRAACHPSALNSSRARSRTRCLATGSSSASQARSTRTPGWRRCHWPPSTARRWLLTDHPHAAASAGVKTPPRLRAMRRRPAASGTRAAWPLRGRELGPCPQAAWLPRSHAPGAWDTAASVQMVRLGANGSDLRSQGCGGRG
jgi:hypothetical protein